MLTKVLLRAVLRVRPEEQDCWELGRLHLEYIVWARRRSVEKDKVIVGEAVGIVASMRCVIFLSGCKQKLNWR